MSVREVGSKMSKMVEEMKQHGKDFEEMTKISSVDTIKLRNNRILVQPEVVKPFKKRYRELSSLEGEVLSEKELKVITGAMSQSRLAVIDKKCGCPPLAGKFTKSVEHFPLISSPSNKYVIMPGQSHAVLNQDYGIDRGVNKSYVMDQKSSYSILDQQMNRVRGFVND